MSFGSQGTTLQYDAKTLESVIVYLSSSPRFRANAAHRTSVGSTNPELRELGGQIKSLLAPHYVELGRTKVSKLNFSILFCYVLFILIFIIPVTFGVFTVV